MTSRLALAAVVLAACVSSPPPERPLLADRDADGILDVHEGEADPDGDGLANWSDADSDGDGLPDAAEAGDTDPLTHPVDSDSDGVPDFLDLDSDANLRPDASEHDGEGRTRDTDADGVGDPWDLDDDGDGALDLEESFPAGAPRDTDGDTDIDKHDVDSDDDGALDRYEAREHPWLPLRDTDGDGTPDLRDLDSDGDHIPDTDEHGDGLAPRDTDGDGTPDLRDLDSDNDGLSDAEEVRTGTRPYDRDTDDDGFPDGVERRLGTDPIKPGSKLPLPLVELSGRQQVTLDVELVAGDRRVDIVVAMETFSTHAEMSGIPDPRVRAAILDFLNTLPRSLKERLPAAAISVAILGGHPEFVVQSNVGPPVFIDLPLTADPDRIDALSVTSFSVSKNTYDAHLQLVEGRGYDRHCDGRYDPDRDVLPFLASPDDAFGGLAGGRWDPADPSAGLEGGSGFRPLSLRYLLDLRVRAFYDPDDSFSGFEDFNLSPDGCPVGVGSESLASALAQHHVQYVGVDLRGGDFSEGDRYWNLAAARQMELLAVMNASFADVDGDGDLEPFVIDTLNVGDPSTLAPTIKLLGRVIDDDVNLPDFDRLIPVRESDPHGFVTHVEPASVVADNGDVPQRVPLTVTLTGTVPPAAADQVFRVRLALAGDGEVALDATEILVVVPGDGKDD